MTRARIERRNRMTKVAQLLMQTVSIAFFSFLTLIYIRNLYYNINNTVYKSLTFIETYRGKIAGVLILTFIGYTLFKFKKYQQFWYGVSEFLFSIFTCYYVSKAIKATDIISPNLNIAISSIPAIYLIVRGISNIHDGIGKEKYVGKFLIEKVILSFHRKYRFTINPTFLLFITLGLLIDQKKLIQERTSGMLLIFCFVLIVHIGFLSLVLYAMDIINKEKKYKIKSKIPPPKSSII